MTALLRQQATLLEHVGRESASSVRPQALPRETFDAFWISESPLSGLGALKPLYETADTLADAVAAAVLRCAHKAKFAIRHTNNLAGTTMWHFYMVRQRSKGVARYHEYQTRVMHDQYAELLFVLDGAAVAAIGGGK